MNLVKVQFKIDIDNDEQVSLMKNFITSLKGTAGESVIVKAPVETVRTKTEVAETATPAATAVATNSAGTPIASCTLVDIRAQLGIKVENNRDAIKNKLSELGAESATNLSLDKYDEFYKFLKAL